MSSNSCVEASRGEAVPPVGDCPEGPDAGALLAAIVESSDDAIVSKSLQGIITSWNQGAQRLFGYSADEVIGKPVTILIPTDRLDEEPAILARLQAGERVDHFETIRRRKDGTLLDISLTVSPIRNTQGKIVGASKIARDVTERKRHAEQQSLLLREMHHRVKNLFALAGGLVTLAAKNAETPSELAHGLRERLNALAKAHEITLPNLQMDSVPAQHTTTLFRLLQTLTAPYQEGARPRCVMSGLDVEISAGSLTSLSLLLHEFMTNAVKYGAFSADTGDISVESELHSGTLHLTWRESGGPPVSPPDAELGTLGFGSRLETVLRTNLKCQIMREWHREGIVIRALFPIAVINDINTI